MLYKTKHYIVITAIMLFVPVAFSQSCTVSTCSVRDFGVPCNFAVDTPARFGDLNGKSFGPVENSRFKLIPDVHLGCRNVGTWRDGTRSNGKPFRSPCEKLGSLKNVGPVWLANFRQDRINGRLSFDFQPSKNWEISFLEKPPTIYLNEHLRCHPDDTSLVLVKGRDGSDYCDEDKTEACFYGEIPALFTSGGGDMSSGEMFFSTTVMFLFILLMLMCVCSADSHGGGDFASGFLAGSLLSGWGDSSSSSWGGTSYD